VSKLRQTEQSGGNGIWQRFLASSTVVLAAGAARSAASLSKGTDPCALSRPAPRDCAGALCGGTRGPEDAYVDPEGARVGPEGARGDSEGVSIDLESVDPEGVGTEGVYVDPEGASRCSTRGVRAVEDPEDRFIFCIADESRRASSGLALLPPSLSFFPLSFRNAFFISATKLPYGL
jgi:hypothetical protein